MYMFREKQKKKRMTKESQKTYQFYMMRNGKYRHQTASKAHTGDMGSPVCVGSREVWRM